MSNFQNVCLLSCEKWVDSFPDEIPKHEFSQKHNEKMKTLFQDEPKDKKHRLSRKSITFILIAAIIMAIATTAFAIPTCREFIIEKFTDHSEYNVVNPKNAKMVESLKVNYIPEGFAQTEVYRDAVIYSNKELSFYVGKFELTASIGFDTEKYDSEKININGIEAVHYIADEKIEGIIFNNSEYIFVVNGNISKEELVKVAQNVE